MSKRLITLLFFVLSTNLEAATYVVDNGHATGDSPFGRHSRIMLDANGFPVISFINASAGSLYLLHCNDVNCDGGDEVANTVVSGLGGGAADYGMDLNASGFPVMSYYDAANADLMIIRCNDADCASEPEITTVATADDIGQFSDLVLDAADFPVVTYFNDTTNDLIVLHCLNETCSSGGSFNPVGNFTNGVGNQSIQLNASGFPVIAFSGNFRPRLIRCNDVNCAGNNESIQQLDTIYAPTLAMQLDDNDYPVVAYVQNGGPTKVIHCDDVECDPVVNGDEMGHEVFSSGSNADLALDGSDRPVVISTNGGQFNFIFCNDINCSGNDEFVSTTTHNGSFQTSLTMDDNGFPVAVAYASSGVGGNSSGVRLVHCNDGFCLGDNEASNYINQYKTDVGQHAYMMQIGLAYLWSYYDATNENLLFRRCATLPCDGNDEVYVIDDSNSVGTFNAMTVDDMDNPFISFYDATNGILRTSDCNNGSCSSVTNFTVDPATDVGQHSAVEFGLFGVPVISYFDEANGALKLVLCDAGNCVSFDNEINTVDDGGGDTVGEYTSLELDLTDGFPLISYFDRTNGSLKLAHCNDAACDPTINGTESIVVVDDGSGNSVGLFTAMKKDANGFPVISYYDETAGALKLAHCGNVDCSAGNSVITVDDGDGHDVGQHNALALDDNGWPVISYHDATDGDLKLAKCINPNCTGYVYQTTVATVGDVGQFTSLIVTGNTAHISYYNATDKQLEVMDVTLPDIIFAAGFD